MYKVFEKVDHIPTVKEYKGVENIVECNGRELGEVNIRGGIFQGDSLLLLFFVIAMLHKDMCS